LNYVIHVDKLVWEANVLFLKEQVSCWSWQFVFSPLNLGHFYEFRKFIKISPVGIMK
jgi:hypothetical protein